MLNKMPCDPERRTERRLLTKVRPPPHVPDCIVTSGARCRWERDDQTCAGVMFGPAHGSGSTCKFGLGVALPILASTSVLAFKDISTRPRAKDPSHPAMPSQGYGRITRRKHRCNIRETEATGAAEASARGVSLGEICD